MLNLQNSTLDNKCTVFQLQKFDIRNNLGLQEEDKWHAITLRKIAATDLKENTSRVDIDKALNKINPKSNRKHYQVKGSGKIKINRAMNKLGKKAKYRVKRSAKKLARAPIKITTKVAKKAVRKAISSKLGYQQMYQLTGYFSPNYTPH